MKTKKESPFKKGCLDFNVDMKNDVMINFTYLDEHIAPDETMPLYARLRNEGIVHAELKIGKYNKVWGIQLDDTYWYLSCAADKKGKPAEQLFFWEIESLQELKDDIKHVVLNNKLTEVII